MNYNLLLISPFHSINEFRKGNAKLNTPYLKPLVSAWVGFKYGSWLFFRLFFLHRVIIHSIDAQLSTILPLCKKYKELYFIYK
jgi:hypothetical protein